MPNYPGIKFVCNSPGSFQIKKHNWKYQVNKETSLIRVSQVGVCNSDISRLFLGSGHKYPITIGHEIVGNIESAGGELDSSLGMNVCVFPLLPCRLCESCKRNAFNLCSQYSYLGSRQDGGMSSFIEIPNWNLIVLKETIKSSYLPMIEPAAVVFHAIKLIRGESSRLLITGSGFLSYLALKIGQYLEFDAIRILSKSKSNLNLFGNYLIDEVTKPVTEFDVCIDFSANASLMESVTKMLSPQSTIVTVANSRDDTFIPTIARERILRKELIYRGSWNSSYGTNKNDWFDAIHFLSLDPLLEYPVKQVPLEQFPHFLQSNASVFPKERIHVLC